MATTPDVTPYDLIARHASANRAYRDSLPPESYVFPAREFEQETGLQGIAQDYVMPGGQTPHEVFLPLWHRYVQVMLLDGCLGCADKLEALTPEHLDALHHRLDTERAAFRKEMKQVERHGTMEQLEALAVSGYQLEMQRDGCRILRDIVSQCGPMSKEELRAIALNVERAFVVETYGCYQQLERHNPELAVLTPQIETHAQRWDVVNGVLSKFNIPDITRYSIDDIKGYTAKQDPAWVARQEKIESTVGSTYWIPAPSTQRLILQQVQAREKSSGIGH